MNIVEKLQEVTKNILAKAGFQGEVEVTEDTQSYRVSIHIQSDQGGANLAALQHLIRLLTRKSFQEVEGGIKDVYVDINDYWKEKDIRLAAEANEKARMVKETGIEHIFPPMGAHERKVIHNAIINIDGVQTESIGNRQDRQVRLYKAGSEEAL
jgi:spoIIIJ-associated protein